LIATSSRASVAVAAPQAPANVFIGGNDDSETESQCEEGGIGGSAESDDGGGDADLAETGFEDTPWLDAVVQNRPLCGTRTGQSLVPMSDIKPLPGRRGTQMGVQKCDGFITALHFFEALFSREIGTTFILYKLQTGAERGDTGFALLDYTKLLIQQQCEEQVLLAVESQTLVRFKKNRRLEVCLADPERLTGPHFPEMFRRSENDPHDMRRACKMCGKKVPFRCQHCNIALCIDAPAVIDSCWVKFHTDPVSYSAKKKSKKK
jgi:hypothetical protein